MFVGTDRFVQRRQKWSSLAHWQIQYLALYSDVALEYPII